MKYLSTPLTATGPAQPSPDRPFILCQNAYDQMDTRSLRSQLAGVHLIACILTSQKGRSQWAPYLSPSSISAN
ncbi:hypothetical protein J6590_031324, partial [Homalodisca vitripennis]